MIPLRLAMRYLSRCMREPRPFEVEAAVLNDCNLQCRYCRCRDVKKSRLTTEQWLAIIGSMANLGTLRFKLHGGEPTLRSDFRDLCAEIQANHMISAAVTNGTIIPDRPELLDHLDELIVSLDSHIPLVHDKTRGQGTHERAVCTIDLALERRVSVTVNMVITRETLTHVEPMLEFCEARGIAMNAQPIVFGATYYNEQARSLELTDGEIRAIHLKLLEWKKRRRPIVFSRLAYEKVLKWPDFNILTIPKRQNRSCVAGREYIRLEANGDVIPCCQYGGDFAPKNIIDDGIVESLRHARSHVCGDCWLAYYNERNALFKLKLPALMEVLRK